MLKNLQGKTVLVTGAGGSIGSALCERLARAGARRLVLLSLTENGLYNIERKMRALHPELEVIPVLGSTNHSYLLRQVFKNDIDIVVHAAAHKHVALCELNPMEAIENNVGGTYALALAAAQARVDQFVLISSDKAVQPTSVMGATKRVAERIIQRPSCYASETRFVTARFGNVMDTAGSVLPLWREQIAQGLPVTVTHPECTRYFMTMQEAVELILGVIDIESIDGTYIFDMGQPRNMLELAEQIIDGRFIDIKYIGLRPGEKLTEELHHGGELQPTSHPKINRVLQPEQEVLKTSELQAMLRYALEQDPAALKLLWKLAT